MKFLLPLLILIAGCKDPAFDVYSPDENDIEYVRTHNIKEVNGELVDGVDILWVIDNSGSMGSSQQLVKDNSAVFINEFNSKTTVDWQMGLISTDRSESPYLSFANDGRGRYGQSSPNAITRFTDAIDDIGTRGSATEEHFLPLQQHLTNDPAFLRPNNAFVMIFVTDEPEQSRMNSQSFINYIKTLRPNDKHVRAFAVLRTRDLGCTRVEDQFTYANGKFKPVVDQYNGFALSMCDAQFGSKLSDIGKIIVDLVTNPKIYLDQSPKLDTLKVIHRGVELLGGPEADGGLWYYDGLANAVVFYNLDFAPDYREDVVIQFKVAY